MNIELAEKFLARFNYDRTTIQVFPTLINGKAKWPRKGGKYLATGKPGSTALAFNGALHNQPFLKDLYTLQRQRMGVYFMVNEGDGEFHNHKIVRNSDAVHILKALFVDTDAGDRYKLDKFCKETKLKPHSIIESSKGKYHYYFLIAECPATKENVFNWQSCQQRLAALDPAFDQSMADLGQVLRVPGFYHTKKEPFLIRQVYESHHDKYQLLDVFKRIGADKTPARKGSKFERPKEKITLGARHEILSTFLGSLSNSVRDSEALIDAGIGFSQRHFTNPSEWLPSGNRYKELCDQVNYVCEQREKEDQALNLQALSATATTQGFKKLPDSFYKKAPGIVGKIVREIVHYSPQPYPSFAFASACALIGTLKAPFIRGEFMNTPPSLYALCLAESGRGKDFPRAMLTKAFMRLGLNGLITQKFRSAQGFLKRLSKAQGIHFIHHDEAHHLFAQIRKGDTDYITTLKPLLLELFSSANSPLYDCGSVVTSANEIEPIAYPTINYCGYGVPTGFEETFQSGELFEGLLTRFLIFRDHQEVLPLTGQLGKVPKVFQFEAPLRELSTKLRIMAETALLPYTNGKGPPQRKFILVPISSEARVLIDQYSERIALSRNDPATPKALDLLQSRLVEQVNRLSVILSADVITKEIIQYSIDLVDHCYQNVALHIESFSKGQGNRDIDKLITFISERNRINNGPMQAQELKYFYIENRHALTNTLQLVLDLKLVQKIDDYRKPGVNTGRLSTAYMATQSI